MGCHWNLAHLDTCEHRQRDQGWTGGALGGERGSAEGDAVNCDHFKIYTNIQSL